MRRLSILALLLLCACGGHKAAESSESPPPLLIDERGTTMPLEKVVTHIVFRPFIPSAQVMAYAVLPPLGDLDTNPHRGIGIEYAAGHNAMLLSEWPKQGYTIAFGHGQLAVEPCKPTHYSTQAVAWTTPGNLVMSLQPDGAAPSAAVDLEARRLIRLGACR
jgi:hypothetical protein